MHVTMDSTRGGRGVDVDGRASRRAAALVVAVVVIAGCTPRVLDEPAASEEQAFAIQLCKEVDALAAVDADPERILYPAVVLSQEAWNRDLEEELFTDEVLARCGPIIEAAAAAEEARSGQAWALADLIVVTIDRCDGTGASGTVTNTSREHTVVEGSVEIYFRGGSGMGYLGALSIGHPTDPVAPAGLTQLGPGDSRPWSIDLEHLRYYNEGPLPRDEVIVDCESSHVFVWRWDGQDPGHRPLAAQACAEIEALASVGALPETILYPLMALRADALRVGLSEADFEREVGERCGDAIEAARAARGDRSAEAMAIADQLTITIDRCDDSGASGTVTNMSREHTVVSAWVGIDIHVTSGRAFSGGVSIGSVHDPESVPWLEPGGSHTWSVDFGGWLEDEMAPGEVITGCEPGFVNVGRWEVYSPDTTREWAPAPAATACDDPVGSDLVELAIASGKAAGGEDLPNYGVGLFNGSMTDGRDTGECVAMVNASLDHVMQAAASLGWAIDNGRVVSPNQVVVGVEQEPPEPDVVPLVTLTARR